MDTNALMNAMGNSAKEKKVIALIDEALRPPEAVTTAATAPAVSPTPWPRTISGGCLPYNTTQRDATNQITTKHILQQHNTPLTNA